VSVFRPEEIEAVLRRHGFGQIGHCGADEARAAYFGGQEDVLMVGAQRIITGTVT
jgi:hypothetical protein